MYLGYEIYLNISNVNESHHHQVKLSSQGSVNSDREKSTLQLSFVELRVHRLR